jgi:hypothetical protein
MQSYSIIDVLLNGFMAKADFLFIHTTPALKLGLPVTATIRDFSQFISLSAQRIQGKWKSFFV